MSPAPALLAVAHGSRDPRAAPANAELLAAVAARLPGVAVRLAFLDHGPPDVGTALARLAAEGACGAVVVPLLLTAGYHSRVDLPRALAGAPLPVGYGSVLGPDRRLATALAGRLAEAGVPADAPVVLAAAGSSDPAAQAQVRRMAELLGVRRSGPVTAAFATQAGPTVPAALAAAGPGAAVAAYFLAPGRLLDRVGAASAPLGAHPAVADLVAQRYRAAFQDLLDNSVAGATAMSKGSWESGRAGRSGDHAQDLLQRGDAVHHLGQPVRT